MSALKNVSWRTTKTCKTASATLLFDSIIVSSNIPRLFILGRWNRSMSPRRCCLPISGFEEGFSCAGMGSSFPGETTQELEEHKKSAREQFPSTRWALSTRHIPNQNNTFGLDVSDAPLPGSVEHLLNLLQDLVDKLFGWERGNPPRNLEVSQEGNYEDENCLSRHARPWWCRSWGWSHRKHLQLLGRLSYLSLVTC